MLQFASDLHLEFPDNREYLLNYPLKPAADILVLAGDIMPLAQLEWHGWFWDRVSAQFKTVYWVPGNHEYYHLNAESMFLPTTHRRIRENVFFVNNQVVEDSGIRLVLSTMWSHISPQNAPQAERRLGDFHYIEVAGRRLNAGQFNEAHRIARLFLDEALSQRSPLPTVVVTHHVPTMMHYPEQYKGDALNEAFAVECFDFIEEKQPACWIFGHHHQNLSDFQIGRTTLATNQLGYVFQGEHVGFSGARTVEVT